MLSGNAGIEQAYSRDLQRLIGKMIYETEREVNKVFKVDSIGEIGMDASSDVVLRVLVNQLRDKFELLFRDSGKSITDKIISRIDRHSEGMTVSSLEKLSGGLSVKPDFIKGPIKQSLRASTTQNVGLISSIESQYYDQVEGIVMRSIQPGGGGAAQVKQELTKLGLKTSNRGVNIARDQTRKAYNSLNAIRMQQSGIRQFKWRHSGAGKNPRPLHESYHMKIFSLDDPPIIDERTGERGLPGQAINCKCSMQPILTFTKGNAE